jgi:hypothetical protein
VKLVSYPIVSYWKIKYVQQIKRERERERESSLGSWNMCMFGLGNYNHTTRNINIIKITLFWSMVCIDEPRVSRSKPNIINFTDVWSLNFTTQVIVALVPSTVIVCTEHIYWCKSYFKQDYVAPMLKLSVQICYGCHHALFDRYEISISQKTMGLLLLT